MKKVVVVGVLFITLVLTNWTTASRNYIIGFYNYSNDVVVYKVYQVNHGLKGFVDAVNVSTMGIDACGAGFVEKGFGRYYVVYEDREGGVLDTTDKFWLDGDMLFIYVGGNITEERIER